MGPRSSPLTRQDSARGLTTENAYAVVTSGLPRTPSSYFSLLWVSSLCLPQAQECQTSELQFSGPEQGFESGSRGERGHFSLGLRPDCRKEAIRT